MRIRCHVEQTDAGILLRGIASKDDAESLCNFFRQQGLPATITPFSIPGDCGVFVMGLTMDRFTKMV
jgi:hypothetical protein